MSGSISAEYAVSLALRSLLLHFFNVCSGLVILFTAASERALDARNAKRTSFESRLSENELRLSSAAPPFPQIDVA